MRGWAYEGMTRWEPGKCWRSEGLLPPTRQGLPSRTKTGTATRRGDGSAPGCCCSWTPFSCCARFVLYRWFWNQIFTWVGVRRIILARCSRSGADRYLCCRNRRSSSNVCALEKSTRRFRFLWLCDPGCPLLSSSVSSMSSSFSSNSCFVDSPVVPEGAPVKLRSDTGGDVLSGLTCCCDKPLTAKGKTKLLQDF